MKSTAFAVLLFLSTTLACAADVPSSSLDEYLRQHGAIVTEGYISRENFGKVAFFTKLLRTESHIENIGEIGFNAGHSSDLFLSVTSRTKVVSFDIMEHSYARIGKQYIDMKYPGRHLLIEGNSLISVPDFSQKHPAFLFDLIFIDGGHDFNTAYHDIVNMKKLSSTHTLVIIDDINYAPVASAWNKCLNEGSVTEIQRFVNKDKIWVMGKYINS